MRIQCLLLEERDALSKRAGGIPTRGKRATYLTLLFAAKAGKSLLLEEKVASGVSRKPDDG